MIKKPFRAQILVITLLVLMIVAVIVVGLVAVSSRDVSQTVSNQKYTELYNSAETAVLKMIDKFGNPDVALTDLANSNEIPADFTCQLDTTLPGQYMCQRDETNARTQLLVRDSKDVVEYELGKDKSFIADLGGYRGMLEFDWTGTTAMEFSLIYSSGATISVIGDVFDTNSPLIYQSNGGDPFTDPQSNHAFPFQDSPGKKMRFDIDAIAGLPAGTTTLSLRITARMPGTGGRTLLTMRATGAGLPNQVRVFEASSYALDQDTDILAEVITQVPLYPQIASVFHYALLSNSVVQK